MVGNKDELGMYHTFMFLKMETSSTTKQPLNHLRKAITHYTKGPSSASKKKVKVAALVYLFQIKKHDKNLLLAPSTLDYGLRLFLEKLHLTNNNTDDAMYNQLARTGVEYFIPVERFKRDVLTGTNMDVSDVIKGLYELPKICAYSATFVVGLDEVSLHYIKSVLMNSEKRIRMAGVAGTTHKNIWKERYKHAPSQFRAYDPDTHTFQEVKNLMDIKQSEIIFDTPINLDLTNPSRTGGDAAMGCNATVARREQLADLEKTNQEQLRKLLALSRTHDRR